ncbi:STAS domain-containing protein [Saccharothrix saharensis]|uniref:STAS domain-containing protein n=1 Tax=Saccharothrix saharensis TaxID=571190 RepID=UPI0036B36E32
MTEAHPPTPRPSTVTDGDVAIVRIGGEVDMSNSDDLRGSCVDALDGGAGVLVVDLSEVTFFASSGIAALSHLREHNSSHRRRPVHVVASRSVRRSLEATAMDKLLPLHETVEEALTAAKSEAG